MVAPGRLGSGPAAGLRLPPLGQRPALLATLAATHLVDDLYQGAIPALLPFLALERHYSYIALTGITLAATFLSSLIQPVFGVLTDRHRRGWLIPVGVLVAGAGVGLAGLGPDYLWTWLAVALSGLGVAAFHPEATRSARGLAGNSTQAMSWFSVGGSAGLALGPLLVGLVLTTTHLPGSPLLAVPALLMAALLALTRPWRPTRARQPTVSGPGAPLPPPRDDWRGFRHLTALVMARSVAYFGVVSLLGLYLVHHFHQTAGASSLVLSLFVGTGTLAVLAGGWLADRWQRLGVVRICYAGSVPALLLLVAAPSLGLALVGVVLLGICLLGPFAIQVTLGQDYLPNRVGTASGVTLGLAISVGGVATPIFGLLAENFGLRTALTAVLVVLALALLLASTMRAPTARALG